MPGDSSGSSLEDALALVAAACLTGGVALARTKTLIRQTMINAETPPAIQALGMGLVRVMDGQRGEEAIAGLPPEVAQLVRAVLEMIEKEQQKNGPVT